MKHSWTFHTPVLQPCSVLNGPHLLNDNEPLCALPTSSVCVCGGGLILIFGFKASVACFYYDVINNLEKMMTPKL